MIQGRGQLSGENLGLSFSMKATIRLYDAKSWIRGKHLLHRNDMPAPPADQILIARLGGRESGEAYSEYVFSLFHLQPRPVIGSEITTDRLLPFDFDFRFLTSIHSEAFDSGFL